MIGIQYFPWLGTMYLCILTYQDIRHKMKIDDRANHFMLGIAISLYSHFEHGIYYTIGLIVLALLMRHFLLKYKAVGEGDINTLSWVFIGFGILNIWYVILFYVIFISVTLLYIAMRKILKIKNATPFYPVILISFVANCLLLGIYL